MESNIEKVSLAVQIEGKMYFVALPQERLQLLIKMAEGLSDTGRLPVIKAPDGFSFTNFAGLGEEEGK